MDYTEETRAADESFGREGTLRGQLLARALLSSFPLGLFWLTILVVLLLTGSH